MIYERLGSSLYEARMSQASGLFSLGGTTMTMNGDGLHEEISDDRLQLLEDIAARIRARMRANPDVEAWWSEKFGERASFDDVLGV